MAIPDPTTPQHGMRRQLVIRFLLVFAFASLLGGAGTIAGYRYVSSGASRQSANQTAAHITQHLRQIAREWDADAAKLKAQIEFTRMLEGNDPKRWARLRAYLTVREGEVKNYDSMVIRRRDGSIAFAAGSEGENLGAEHLRALAGEWHLSEDRRTLYRVAHLPLWLGDEGHGTMVFLHPVENATLVALAPPGVDLYLLAGHSVIASSRGSAGVAEALAPDFSGSLQLGSKRAEQRWLSIDPASPATARLVIRQQQAEPLTAPLLIGSGALLLLLLTLMLWLALGRWSHQIAQRIGSLSQAARLFARQQRMDGEMRQLVEPALARLDEIGMLGASCQDMMHSVAHYHEEQLAYVQTLDMLEEGVVEIAPDGRFLRASAGWQKLAKCDDCNLGQCFSLYQCIHDEDKQVFGNQLAALFAGVKLQITGRTRLSQSTGNQAWVEYRFVGGASGPDGTMHSARGIMRDITQSYQLEKRVTHMALHDALTGLPNRVLLEDRCELSLRMAERTGHKVAVGFIDLDHFKNINDTFGHKTGDRLLVVLANALKDTLRAGDTLARWGGDEFIVLLPDLPDIDIARQVTQKLVDTCAQQVTLDDNEFTVTFSIGVALYPDDANNVETLLSQADRAMFHAKEQGRNNLQFFCDMTRKGLGKKDVYIQNRLAGAIKNRQIQAWFQPLVEAGSRRVVGVEALARWHDEEYGWISPATFIPIAENLGMIRDLGEQVWMETLRQGKRWRDAGIDLQLAVNMSRRQLFLPSFTHSLLENLREFDIPPSAIILEITESVALTDLEYTSRRLKELADAGFTLAIDDFGTGYSSLSQLHHMPVGKIKIDISFVQRVHEPQGAELVQAIIHMADAFGLHIVAEGVEDENTADILRQYGVHLLQGYFFGKPMPAAEIDHYLAEPTLS